MSDYEDYYPEHDRPYREDRGQDGGRPRCKDEGVGRDYRERERHDREREHLDRERERLDRDPRDYDRRRDERDRYDRRDDDRRRPPIDDRYDRGPAGYREPEDRRGTRSDPREDYRERRRSRSRERRRSRSRDRYGNSPRHHAHDRRDERERGSRGRGSRGGRRDAYSDEDETFGGYRPRKRQAPPDPSKYDKPLPPGAGPGHIQDPFYYLRQNVPTDPAEAQRLWLEQQLRSRQMVLQQQAASAAAASAKTQRELYIGNLVPGAVTDVALRQLFNTTLAAAFPVTTGVEPVVNVNLHSDGRYAFVEFRTPEMATAALALNAQVQLLGQTISVGRPSGYVDPHKAAAAAQAAAQALAAFQAGDMAALAANATAAGMNLAQLGLANLILPKPAGDGAAVATNGGTPAPEGTPPQQGGVSAPETSTVAGLPLVSYADEGAHAQMQASLEQLPQPWPSSHPHHQQPHGEAPEAEAGSAPANGAAEALMELAATAFTPYLCVLGMLTSEMLIDDEEYLAVIDDLTEECDRHATGGVVGVKVPRPPEEVRRAGSEFMGTGLYGKAFVAFKDIMAAQRAHAAIHGRLFAGSTVHAQYISAEEFNAV